MYTFCMNGAQIREIDEYLKYLEKGLYDQGGTGVIAQYCLTRIGLILERLMLAIVIAEDPSEIQKELVSLNLVAIGYKRHIEEQIATRN